MPNLTFSHPQIDTSLTISAGANQITWAYGLNTATIPTYGGEVIQILSVYIDDLTITGQLYNPKQPGGKGSYSEMERIYTWFLSVFQKMTQGAQGTKSFQNYLRPGDDGYGESYNITPISMRYDERGWRFSILPKTMPGFRYGRDVIVPEYQIQAAVVQSDSEALTAVEKKASQQLHSITEAEAEHLSDLGEVFGSATGDIGYVEDNRFSAPYKGDFDPKKSAKLVSPYADYFHNIVPSYLSGDFTSLAADLSKPAFGPQANVTTGESAQAATKKALKKANTK